MVGRYAQMRALLHPKDVFHDITRLFGMRCDGRVGQKQAVTVPYKTHSPRDLFSSILSRIKNLAETFLARRDGIKVVVALPPSFSDEQEKGTELAVCTAGFELLSDLRRQKNGLDGPTAEICGGFDPTANDLIRWRKRRLSCIKPVVAVPPCFGDEQKREMELLSFTDHAIAAMQFCTNRKNGLVAVYSFGGQYHFSILQITNGIITVKKGGGRKFDTVVLEHILGEKFEDLVIHLVERTRDPDGRMPSSRHLAEWAATCHELGLWRPTLVERWCIPAILAGADVLGVAQTGSGKTTALALPILNKLAQGQFGVFVLVLAPTRELASRLAEQFKALGVPINLRCMVAIGGYDTIDQARGLAGWPHVVIATPGRIRALIQLDPVLAAVFSHTKIKKI